MRLIVQQLLRRYMSYFFVVVIPLNISDYYICFQVKHFKFRTVHLLVLFNSHNQQLFYHLVFEMETVFKVCDTGAESLN
jgi:hypothetical protein